VTRVTPGVRTILIVEPDERTATGVVGVLGRGVRALTAQSGGDAIARLGHTDPALVLLAFALPDMPGLALCSHIRRHVPRSVVFVSGCQPEVEAPAAYAAGADGYLLKPYRLRELDARIQAAVRRAPAPAPLDSGAMTVGDVTLSPRSHEVRVRGRVVPLPLREFELLSVLLARPGKIWGREALMRRVWVETPPSGTKSLDVHVRRIRGKIENEPSRPTRILTVRGVGYQYAVPAVGVAGAGR